MVLLKDFLNMYPSIPISGPHEISIIKIDNFEIPVKGLQLYFKYNDSPKNIDKLFRDIAYYKVLNLEMISVNIDFKRQYPLISIIINDKKKNNNVEDDNLTTYSIENKYQTANKMTCEIICDKCGNSIGNVEIPILLTTGNNNISILNIIQNFCSNCGRKIIKN